MRRMQMDGPRWTRIDGAGEMFAAGRVAPGLYRHLGQRGETMTVLRGQCRVRRTDGGDWQQLESGARFVFSPRTSYEIEVSAPVELAFSPVTSG